VCFNFYTHSRSDFGYVHRRIIKGHRQFAKRLFFFTVGLITHSLSEHNISVGKSTSWYTSLDMPYLKFYNLFQIVRFRYGNTIGILLVYRIAHYIIIQPLQSPAIAEHTHTHNITGWPFIYKCYQIWTRDLIKIHSQWEVGRGVGCELLEPHGYTNGFANVYYNVTAWYNTIYILIYYSIIVHKKSVRPPFSFPCILVYCI